MAAYPAPPDSAPPPGSAEYLGDLLTEPDHSCPHQDKRKQGFIPARLGFFRHTDGTTSYFKTTKLCQSCYNKAVPDGFNVWTTYYKTRPRAMEPRMYDDDEWRARYGTQATIAATASPNWAALSLPSSNDYYPPMMEAGTEDIPNAEVHAEILMPNNAEAREAFRLMRHTGQPFYIGQLHLTRPWDPNAENRKEEDRRVARENMLAYEGAARGYVGTGVGGAGVNSIVEQRILKERMEPIPGSFGFNPNRADDEELLPDPGPRVPLKIQEQEVSTAFPEYYAMPSNAAIDREEFAMRDAVTGPRDGEIERRWFLERRPNSSRLNEDQVYIDGARGLSGTDPYTESDEYETRTRGGVGNEIGGQEDNGYEMGGGDNQDGIDLGGEDPDEIGSGDGGDEIEGGDDGGD